MIGLASRFDEKKKVWRNWKSVLVFGKIASLVSGA